MFDNIHIHKISTIQKYTSRWAQGDYKRSPANTIGNDFIASFMTPDTTLVNHSIVQLMQRRE